MHTNTTLVINWHLTEACNYNCQFCYAKWDAGSSSELIRDPRQAEALLDRLYGFFEPGNPANPLWAKMRWTNVRLNLAGGEPLLYHRALPALVRHAKTIGFEVSLITNASQLAPSVMAELTPYLSWLGISIDSADATTNRNIGRVDRRGNLLDIMALSEVVRMARTQNPQLRLKLNTVVNSLNEAEDLSPLIECLDPNKWKVLRMLPVVTDALAVSDAAFRGFVARHQRFAAKMCAEDNIEMRESYLMVDPLGRFYQNGREVELRGHAYSSPILEAGAAAAFAEISFDPDRFRARYPHPADGGGK